MDMIVQESIKMVLVAICKPGFETLKRSLGFRPDKSCHDAIVSLKSNYTNGFRHALEGDISGAYQNVRKEYVIRCLKKKIQGSKFIKRMSKRLDYDYVDEKRANVLNLLRGFLKEISTALNSST